MRIPTAIKRRFKAHAALRGLEPNQLSGMFAERGSKQPDGGVLPMDPVPPPARWAQMGAEPVVRADSYTALDDLFWISGEIPRQTDYERGLRNQVARATPDEPWTPDPLLMDERALVVRVAGKGLVVFSACSHAGIVNVLHHVRASFPSDRIFAAMGGLHLSGENEDAISATSRDLAGFELTHLFPAHCTGWRAIAAFERAFGEPMVAPAAVGKFYTL